MQHQPNYLEPLLGHMNLLLSQSLAPSTLNLYRTAFNSYQSFCQDTYLELFPVNEFKLMLYVTSISNRLAFKSIKTYISGIQFSCTMQGQNIPISSMHQLYYLLRGIRRTQGTSRSRPPRLPITVTHLYKLHNFINNKQIPFMDKLLLWSAITTAFFGLLRSAEYTSSHVKQYNSSYTLLLSDVSFSPNLTYMAIKIRASKTDPFRTGCTVRIGATGNHLCPVSALYHFIRHRTSINRPLFTYSDGSYLTRSRIATILFNCFQDYRINTHSLRIGGATTMASAGIPDSTIMILGRWSSNAYQLYLRMSDSLIRNTTHKMSITTLITKDWDSDVLKSMQKH